MNFAKDGISDRISHATHIARKWTKNFNYVTECPPSQHSSGYTRMFSYSLSEDLLQDAMKKKPFQFAGVN